MTMACSLIPDLNAAQEVRPMKGGICHLSTLTFTSARGEETLNTPSSAFILPERPVMVSMLLVSRSAERRFEAESRTRARQLVVFIISRAVNVASFFALKGTLHFRRSISSLRGMQMTQQPRPEPAQARPGLADFLGLRRNTSLLLAALVLAL